MPAVSPRLSRRECLRVGGLGLAGLNLAHLAALREAAQAGSTGEREHPAGACIFVFLFGGPSHIDLWDMKPAAPAEIRGEFRPVSTNVPDVHVCEHLPLLARQMDKLCLLRSMTHSMNVHGPACSEIYTGREYFGPPVTDQATPRDWPSLASLVMRFGPARGGLPSSIVLPWYTQFAGQAKRIAGQTGGRMGEVFNPFLVEGDPSRPGFAVEGLSLPNEVSAQRFHRRRQLHERLESLAAGHAPQTTATRLLETHYERAFSTIEKAQAAGAFKLEREPAAVRERYGMTRFGQSLLLARRLVERGVSLVTVNWDENTPYDKVSPYWDTHVENFPKLKDRLCPPFDRSFSGFLSDLDERGLLESTLVVAVGEFGRTPKVGRVTQNGQTENTGRDHWPHAFTALLAGGGVRGGQAYGATTANGGYVDANPVSPADLAATVLFHLGVDRHRRYYDRFQSVRQPLCEGTPLTDLG